MCRAQCIENGEDAPCDESNFCSKTGGEPFELLPENVETSIIFIRAVMFSPVIQLREQGMRSADGKRNSTVHVVYPTIQNLDTVLNNWYRELSLLERSDIVYKIGEVYQMVIQTRRERVR